MRRIHPGRRGGLSALILLLTGCASGGGPAAPAGSPGAAGPAPVDAPAGAPAAAEVTAPDVEPLEPGRFDMGKMWTFENAPLDYFEEAYGFRPSQEWLDGVRMATLRLPGCTASFVSPRGLVMTNHHCARGAVSRVSREGESLLDEGFYATTEADERPIPRIWVDQLVRMEDVTPLVAAAIDDDAPAAEQVTLREARMEAVGDSASAANALRCDVTALYRGGKYSLYCYRRFDDVRLVFAPELRIGYYGGDADNFTYPRYNLDVSFLRVYGDDGEPYAPREHFGWSRAGADAGEPVFVVGNPGSTERLRTVAQLVFARDYREPYMVRALVSRTDILKMFIDHHPEERDRHINRWFGWMNARKLYTGRLRALEDPEIMGRKAGFEARIREAVDADPRLRAEYGDLWDEIAGIRREMEAVYPESRALNLGWGLNATTLSVAGGLVRYARAAEAGAPDSVLQRLRRRIESRTVQPDLDAHVLAAQLDDARWFLGDDDPWVEAALGGRNAGDAARAIVRGSRGVVDMEARRALLDDPAAILESGEAALVLAREALPRHGEAARRLEELRDAEEVQNARLARAVFEVYGTELPPDATFTLRLADGVVEGYDYNGTRAPAWTTFHGLYDRHYGHAGDPEWALPDRWLDPPADFDLETPLNMVSTNDITGGNSGSPVIDRDRRVVGLIFDGNIESLSGDFIYTTETARSVSVRAEGILEALRDLYGARRIADELVGGRTAGTPE